MTSGHVVRGYAAAVFEVAKAEGVLDQVEDELFRFARVVDQNPELRQALHDINLPPEHRARMVAELLGQRVSPHTVSLIGFVVTSGQARVLTEIAETVVELAAEERTRGIAEVRSTVPLGAEQREKLREAVRAAMGKDVELRVLIDPSLIGGLLVRVGDQVFDGSVRRRLQTVKERLVLGGGER